MPVPSMTLSYGSTTYFLINSSGAPTAGGAATAINTTCFSIRDNWTPRAVLPSEQYAGGPPFRSGASLVTREYENVLEAVPIRCVGSSHVNAVARLQLLKILLKQCNRLAPAHFSFISDTASGGEALTDVYGGYIQEEISTQTGLQAAEGGATIDATMYLLRNPYWGVATGVGETLLNAVTFTNTGSGGANEQQLTNGSGDFVGEGQPLNIKFLPANVASRFLGDVYAAVLGTNHAYSTTGAGTAATSSTTGVTFATLANFDFSIAVVNPGIKPRIVMRIQLASNAEVRVVVQFANSAYPIYTSDWLAATITGAATLIDFGTFPLNMLQRLSGLGSPAATVTLQQRSTNGASASVTLSSTEYLLYWDFCLLQPLPGPATNGTKFLYLQRFNESSSSPTPACLPLPAQRAFVFNGTTWDATIPVRGSLPRYYGGSASSLLWLAWTDDTGHVTTRTATVTVTHAPLWHTYRGND